jgi:hypothetical protein
MVKKESLIMKGIITQATESEVESGTIVETINKTDIQENSPSDGELKINRHKVDYLTLYEITESELEIIENGTPSSLYLNFAIFLLSMAVSFMTSLLTVDYEGKQTLFLIFLVLTILGFIIGVFLIILWWWTKQDFNKTIQRIKNRIC